MKTIYLASSNRFKIEEITEIGKKYSIDIKEYKCDIRELQTTEREKLIRHKTLEAFNYVRSPVLVDHASLEIEALNGMPGTLTQLFWDRLEGRICDIVSALGNPRARAISLVGFCDGRNIFYAEGVKEGNIAPAPLGNRQFQWDAIFIPDGETRTYAEMAIDEKNLISQRKIAYEKLFSEIQ